MQLPAFVKDSAGRLEPFDADRIYRRLFAALDTAGYADPLAARELTDTVLHFLTLDAVGLVVELSDLAARVRTVLRELRHAPVVAALTAATHLSDTCDTPAAAWAFPETAPLTPHEAMKPAFRRYGRALGIAQELGLLTLDAVGEADALAAMIMRLPPPEHSALEYVESLRGFLAPRLILDTPELDGVLQGWRPAELAAFMRELAWATAIHGVAAELHLHLPDPPWGELAAGPLFRCHVDPVDEQLRSELAATLTQTVIDCRTRLWSGLHLVAHPTLQAHSAVQPHESMHRVSESGAVVSQVDALGQVSFGCGLSRQRKALLAVIDLHVPVLWERQRAPVSPEQLLGKVLSLARLAASAGTQKRNRLRQLWSGDAAYYLEASHVHLRVRGLAPVLAELAPPQPAALRRTLQRRLTRTLKEEGQLRSLPLTFELLEDAEG